MRRPGLSRRGLVLVLAAFALTRAVAVPLALQPSTISVSFADLEKYELWSDAALTEGRRPYQDVPIEYPPGVLPFIIAPRMVADADTPYATPFAGLMLLLDIGSFVTLLLLARRWGSLIGPWVWVLGIFMIGPIVYLRLDLIPAFATILALYRALDGGWTEAGAWLGFGAAAKVYPAFLLPAMFAVAPKRMRVVLGASAVLGLIVIPSVVVGAGPELWRDVIGYHGDRGIHVESTWGFLLLAASKIGREVSVNYQFGANEVISDLVGPLKAVGTGLSLAALGLSFVVARWRVVRGDAHALASVCFGTLALLMGLGTVFSPQYMVWLVAVAAVVMSKRMDGPRWLPVMALSALPAAALTHLVYPRTIGEVLQPFYEGSMEAGSPVGLFVLGLRNLLVLGSGALTFWLLWRQDREPESTLR